MKRYLSRIANQSGPLLSSSGTVSLRTAREPHAGLPLEPFDRKETLMMAPGSAWLVYCPHLA